MDASDRTECLQGTRIAMIQLITDWALDPAGAQNVMLLHGIAGVGKSTLSTTIANRFREQGRRVPSFSLTETSKRGVTPRP